MQLVAAAIAQYFIIAYALFVVLCLFTNGLIYTQVLTLGGNLAYRYIFEIAIALILTQASYTKHCLPRIHSSMLLVNRIHAYTRSRRQIDAQLLASTTCDFPQK